MLDAILNLDMDFFMSPPYFGRFYGSSEPTSFSSYYSTCQAWTTPEAFIKKLDLKHRIHGETMRDDNQSYYYIKTLIDKGEVEPHKFTIVNFDAHHDMYIHWDENWFRSTSGSAHNYDNMVMPFIREWIDEIIWVVPDCVDIKSQFDNMKVDFSDNQAIIHLSPHTQLCLKIVKFSDFNAELYNWKYFCLIQNPELSKATPESIAALSKYISRY